MLRELRIRNLAVIEEIAVPLAPGIHHFARVTDERIVWLWAPAFERGFTPFHLRDVDF